ncbi:LacI family DNA-binding transcriptional regulator [Martelella mediterranea]|uniref:LacI family transcriptional regulator n=1 Tax=Martelella mediterranea TaxID=293089 RepID=A0A4R3NJE9_9HYPH|nr:LacI family DNA-binding transcriptional regulator [Martelella mediterranea]TCT33066.1 LacI family transcriptional regulator [Martelella mediterranea]
MVSIKDVAEKAGVSDQTVSRVVHNDAKVDPRTRKRVERAIAKLGYVPNRAARMVRTNRSGVVALVTNSVSTTPFSTDIVRGVRDAIEATPYSLLTITTGSEPERRARCWKTVKEHRCDAVIFVTMYHRQVEEAELDPAVPTVLVNCSLENDRPVPAIVPDDYQGSYDAAALAFEHGHSRIGYVRLNQTILAARLREAGVRDLMRAKELMPREDWFVEGLVGKVFEDRYVAYENAMKILSLEDRPTVMLCGNDELALQVFSAAQTLGLRVPQDLSIVGFDDFQVISDVIRPGLTTMALPYYEMGQRAVRDVVKLIEKQPVETVRTAVPCVPVLRQSLQRLNRV